MKPELKVHRGRARTVYPELKLWRKRVATFNRLKVKVLETLIEHLGGEQAAVWLRTSHPGLKGQTPKQWFKPMGIVTLSRLVRKEFKSTPSIVSKAPSSLQD